MQISTWRCASIVKLSVGAKGTLIPQPCVQKRLEPSGLLARHITERNMLKSRLENNIYLGNTCVTFINLQLHYITGHGHLNIPPVCDSVATLQQSQVLLLLCVLLVWVVFACLPPTQMLYLLEVVFFLFCPITNPQLPNFNQKRHKNEEGGSSLETKSHRHFVL